MAFCILFTQATFYGFVLHSLLKGLTVQSQENIYPSLLSLIESIKKGARRGSKLSKIRPKPVEKGLQIIKKEPKIGKRVHRAKSRKLLAYRVASAVGERQMLQKENFNMMVVHTHKGFCRRQQKYRTFQHKNDLAMKMDKNEKKRPLK